MVMCSPDGLLDNSSDLKLDSRWIPGQQKPVKHVQELHSQQLQQKEKVNNYINVTVKHVAQTSHFSNI